MWKLCLGGSFNPIHHAHLICARAAVEATGADGVVLIPTAIPPHKQASLSLASVEDRLAMCRLATAGQSTFQVDDREIRRGRASFTIDTVRQLRSEGWDQVTWLIGADMLDILPTWREADALLAEARFVIMARPGCKMDWSALPPKYAALQNEVIQVPQLDISATEIRRRISANLPIDFLTPSAVVQYIRDKNLYSTSQV